MTLLHPFRDRRARHAYSKPLDPCWLCVPQFGRGKPCAAHSRWIREAATAQARNSFSLGGTERNAA